MYTRPRNSWCIFLAIIIIIIIIIIYTKINLLSIAQVYIFSILLYNTYWR